jgi:DNA-directed RNA polymerase subunit RPC12/RpoP
MESGERTISVSFSAGEGGWPMANPIKFRCFQCNQLLGVSRTKAGEVVACPKCSAELIVPEIEEVAQQLSAGPSPSTAFESGETTSSRSVASTTLENSLSLDALDIRPEDIRVEAGVVPVSPPPYTYKPPGSEESEPSPAPPVEPGPPASPEVPRPKTIVEPVTPAAYQIAPQPQPLPQPTVVPPIATDEPLHAVQPRRAVAPPPRSRDLVIPRSVVTAWSLLVLIAVGMAFVAGLLAGHYVWGVH